ncbi:MAG: hypothetical protein LIO46_05415 [Clostridiales bacterium]|nr:hypothetical protein [Clostridiales bacterium]
MNYLKFGFHMFSRKLTLSLILVAQLTAGLLLLNFMLSSVQMQQEARRLLSPMLASNAVYFTPQDSWEIRSAPPEYLEELEDVQFLSESHSEFILEDGGEIRIMTYSAETAALADFPLKRGEPFTTAGQDGRVPIVISEERGMYQLGAVFDKAMTCYFVSGDAQEYEEVEITRTFEVVGVLNSAGYYLSFSTGGGIGAADIMQRYDRVAENDEIMFLCTEEALNLPENADRDFIGSYAIVFEDGIAPEAYERNITLLQNNGYLNTMEKLEETTRRDIRGAVQRLLPYIICAVSLSVVGILSANILHALTQSRTFAIFYVCGGRWRNISLSYLAYIGYIVLASLLISGVGLLLIYEGNAFGEAGLSLHAGNFLLSAAVIALCCIMSVLPPYFVLKRMEPAAIIQKYS